MNCSIAHTTFNFFAFLLVMAPSFAESQIKFRLAENWSTSQQGAAFSSDGAFVVTVGDAIRIFDIQTGEIQQTITTRNMTRKVAFLPSKPDRFVVTGDEGKVFLGTVGQSELVKWHTQPSSIMSYVVVSADGKTAVTTGKIYDRKRGSPGLLQRFDVDSGKLVHVEKFTDGVPRQIIFSHDQTKLAVAIQGKSGKGSSRILIYDTERWQVEKTISFGQEFCSGVCFLPDDQHLLITGGKSIRLTPNSTRVEGRLWIVDSRSTDTPRRFPTKNTVSVYRPPVISPDGKFFITATSRVKNFPNRQSVMTQIQCRDSETGKVRWAQDGGVGLANGVKLSPDGKLVVACSDDKLFLFHAKTGHRIAEFDANRK